MENNKVHVFICPEREKFLKKWDLLFIFFCFMSSFGIMLFVKGNVIMERKLRSSYWKILVKKRGRMKKWSG